MPSPRTADPRVDYSRLRRLTPPLLIGGAMLAASIALHVRDPHDPGSWGWCPWYQLTHTSCPGCGGLRAVNDLTRGDLGAAASSNLLFVTCIPVLATMWVRSVGQRWRGSPTPLPGRLAAGIAIVFGVLMVLFTVLRNLEIGAWLAP